MSYELFLKMSLLITIASMPHYYIYLELQYDLRTISFGLWR